MALLQAVCCKFVQEEGNASVHKNKIHKKRNVLMRWRTTIENRIKREFNERKESRPKVTLPEKKKTTFNVLKIREQTKRPGLYKM